MIYKRNLAKYDITSHTKHHIQPSKILQHDNHNHVLVFLSHVPYHMIQFSRTRMFESFCPRSTKLVTPALQGLTNNIFDESHTEHYTQRVVTKGETYFSSPLPHIGEKVQRSNPSSPTTWHRRRETLSIASHKRKSHLWVSRYADKPRNDLSFKISLANLIETHMSLTKT